MFRKQLAPLHGGAFFEATEQGKTSGKEENLFNNGRKPVPVS
jgi:hypothetical protein